MILNPVAYLVKESQVLRDAASGCFRNMNEYTAVFVADHRFVQLVSILGSGIRQIAASMAGSSKASVLLLARRD